MERSFDEVYEDHGREVHAYLARLLGNAASADEVCQDTFVRYLAHEDALASLNGQLRPWLYRVATNLGIDRLRRRRTRKTKRPPVGGRPPQEVRDRTDRDVARRIQEEVDQLPGELRATFLLRAHHGLTYREVASVLGISERAAKARFRKTRDQLAHRLRHLTDANDRRGS